MFYIFEGVVWLIISYYWSKYVSIRSMFFLGVISFSCATFIDPILYNWGFIWTAPTIYISLLIGIPSYIGVILGIVYYSYMHR